jgi:hypothetical protein
LARPEAHGAGGGDSSSVFGFDASAVISVLRDATVGTPLAWFRIETAADCGECHPCSEASTSFAGQPGCSVAFKTFSSLAAEGWDGLGRGA